jgi:hypothetical protein
LVGPVSGRAQGSPRRMAVWALRGARGAGAAWWRAWRAPTPVCAHAALLHALVRSSPRRLLCGAGPAMRRVHAARDAAVSPPTAAPAHLTTLSAVCLAATSSISARTRPAAIPMETEGLRPRSRHLGRPGRGAENEAPSSTRKQRCRRLGDRSTGPPLSEPLALVASPSEGPADRSVVGTIAFESKGIGCC